MIVKLRVLGFAVLACLLTAGMTQAQLNLVPNGDFETPGGVDWGFAGVGTTPSFPDMGGNPGGHGQIDQTAGGWGGVLVSEVSATEGHSLASLGVAAGMTYTFSIDMIDLAGNAPVAGMKVENWAGGGLINDSGDVVFGVTTSWDTYQFDFLVDPGATSLKFVPLLVVQPVGSSVGYDNVGVIVPQVIPEPSTMGLVALGMAGALARRRRRS